MRIQHNTSYEISTSKNIWDYDLTLTYYFHINIHGKRESITLSLHRNGVLKGLKRLTRVQCSWLCIFPSTIFGNRRCRINNKLARVSCFFVHFFAVTARLHCMKLPNLTFSGRQKHTTTTFCFFSWTSIQSLKFNSRKIIGHFPRIGHFPDPKTLTFKMKPSAQPFLWKWVLFAWEWKIISISKAEHLASFWNRGPGELRNGLFTFLVSFS